MAPLFKVLLVSPPSLPWGAKRAKEGRKEEEEAGWWSSLENARNPLGAAEHRACIHACLAGGFPGAGCGEAAPWPPWPCCSRCLRVAISPFPVEEGCCCGSTCPGAERFVQRARQPPGALASARAGPRFRLLGFLLACFPPCHLPALGDPKKQPPRATAGTVTSPVLTGGKAKTFLPPLPSPSLRLLCAPTTSCVAWAEQLEQLGFAVCDLFSRRRKELGGSIVSSPGGCAFPWWG